MKLLALTIAALLLLAGSAQAGVYRVETCPSPTAWTSENTAPWSLRVASSCPAAAGSTLAGGSIATTVGAVNTPAGAGASWTVAAPEGTWIRSLVAQRSFGKRNASWDVAVVTGEQRILDTCELPWDTLLCERGGPGTTVPYDGLHTSSVSFVVRCRPLAGTCPNGAEVSNAWLAVYSATVEIEDPEPPRVQPLSGTILDAGWHRGVDTAQFSASDASGVKSLRLLAGAHEIGRVDQVCDVTRMQPCPSGGTAAFSIDMAQVPDGTHVLRAVASDAADQESAWVGTLRVDTTAPSAPSGLALTQNDDGTYSATWSNPDQGTAAPIVAAHAAICTGTTCVEGPETRTPGVSRIDGIAAPSGDASVRVWLEDEAGNSDAALSATVPFDPGVQGSSRTVVLNPPVLLPSGPKAAPRVRITRARRSRATLTVSGTIAARATARITATVARSRSGKVLARAHVKPKRGKWTVRVRLTPALRRAGSVYLAVTFAGQSTFRKATLSRLVRKPRDQV